MTSVNDYGRFGVWRVRQTPPSAPLSVLCAVICLAFRKKYLINDNDIAQHLFESMSTKKTFLLHRVFGGFVCSPAPSGTVRDRERERENRCDKLLGSSWWVTALKIFICFALNYRFFFLPSSFRLKSWKPIHFKNEIIFTDYIQPQVYNLQANFFFAPNFSTKRK